MRNDGIFPTGNNEEIVAYRKACVRFLPFFGPIAVLHNGRGNARIRAGRTAEYGSDVTLNLFKVGPGTEVQHQPSVSGLW